MCILSMVGLGTVIYTCTSNDIMFSNKKQERMTSQHELIKTSKPKTEEKNSEIVEEENKEHEIIEEVRKADPKEQETEQVVPAQPEQQKPVEQPIVEKEPEQKPDEKKYPKKYDCSKTDNTTLEQGYSTITNSSSTFNDKGETLSIYEKGVITYNNQEIYEQYKSSMKLVNEILKSTMDPIEGINFSYSENDTSKQMTVILNVFDYPKANASVIRLEKENPGSEYEIGEATYDEYAEKLKNDGYTCNATY